MPDERKIMISVRLPPALVARVDFVARNTDSGPVENRSSAVRAAIESWLPAQEDRLEKAGVIQKKTR